MAYTFGAWTQMPTDGDWSSSDIAERYGVEVDQIVELGEWMKEEWEENPTMNMTQMGEHALWSFDWNKGEPEMEEMVFETAFAVKEGKLCPN